MAALVVHRHAVWVEGWPIPWGALLAVAAPVAVGLGLRGEPPALLGFLLGWVAVVLAALGDGPGGDFLLLSDVLGWGFFAAAAIATAVVLGLGLRPRRTRGERMAP